jgi:hypothetical protein
LEEKSLPNESRCPGSKDMFLKRGFEEVADLGDGFVLVRKYLA